MGLPVGQLARSSYDYKGTAIPIRSLTRKETFEIKGMENDLDACEVHLLMCGTDSTKGEVDAFRDTEGDSAAINGLLEAIAKLSGIQGDPKET